MHSNTTSVPLAAVGFTFTTFTPTDADLQYVLTFFTLSHIPFFVVSCQACFDVYTPSPSPNSPTSPPPPKTWSKQLTGHYIFPSKIHLRSLNRHILFMFSFSLPHHALFFLSISGCPCATKTSWRIMSSLGSRGWPCAVWSLTRPNTSTSVWSIRPL